MKAKVAEKTSPDVVHGVVRTVEPSIKPYRNNNITATRNMFEANSELKPSSDPAQPRLIEHSKSPVDPSPQRPQDFTTPPRPLPRRSGSCDPEEPKPPVARPRTNSVAPPVSHVPSVTPYKVLSCDCPLCFSGILCALMISHLIIFVIPLLLHS